MMILGATWLQRPGLGAERNLRPELTIQVVREPNLSKDSTEIKRQNRRVTHETTMEDRKGKPKARGLIETGLEREKLLGKAKIINFIKQQK